jgi:predicted DNA-binding WGR domain protein
MTSVISNGCFIDEYCTHKNGTVIKINDIVYNCTLNQTDLKSNKNKFYIMQIIEINNSYQHFIRYGRIGESGKVISNMFTNTSSAIYAFKAQFKTKTGNNWDNTDNFIPKKGKYFMTKIVYDEIDNLKIDDTKQIQPDPSLLDNRIQIFIKYISDINMINNTLVKLNFDVKKIPLGKINNSQIESALVILDDIKQQMQNNNDIDFLNDKSSEFYTLIPIACGRAVPDLIDNINIIGKYLELLDELKNMIVAIQIIDNNNTSKLNKIDSVYNNLETEITPLDKTSDMWKHITDYVVNTHGNTHNFNISILDILEISRKNEYAVYSEYTKNIPNKHLLFHGSSLSNFCSILQKGLLLNPSMLGVYISGKMFGYGVYTANASSKSIGYCNVNSADDNVGALLLCEVALGNQKKCVNSDYYIDKQSLKAQNFDSTHGIGRYTPSSSVSVDNVIIPNGKLHLKNPKNTLYYDEYIVYDTRQLYLKYIILFKTK